VVRNPVELTPPPRSARDFYRELMRETQSRATVLAERERWLRSLAVEGREELLFEFEMLLRGCERYFNLHNLPIDAQPPVITRDFREELLDVRDAMNEVIRIARRLLDQDSDQKLIFRRYLESRLADDGARRQLIEEEVLEQSTPQESLFLLRQSFESLRTLIDHLVKLDVCSFQLFQEVGTLVLREIVLNHYFRPFRPLEFRIEYDRIRSGSILEVLRTLDGDERRLFTTAFLALFRLLHYLSYVSADAEGPPVRRSRVILALVRSEIASLIGFLREELGKQTQASPHRSAALKVARELTREGQRIARKLLETQSQDPRAEFDAAVTYSQMLRRQVAALAESLGATGEGDDAFRTLVAPLPNSLRLRLELWVFFELCRHVEQALGQPPGPDAAALDGLVGFVHHFHDGAYQLLRYGDFEPFDRFCGLLLELEGVPEGPSARARLSDDCRQFGQIAESMFVAVSRRSELAATRFDLHQAQALLARFKR
jgi:hypothetical protein